MDKNTPQITDRSPDGLTWYPLRAIVALGGVVILWSTTTPYMYGGFFQIKGWVYGWLAFWTVVVAGLGGVLEGTAAWAGYRRIGATVWVLVAFFGTLPFILVTGHWGPNEPADARAFGQLVTGVAFWLATCGCEYVLARRLALQSHPSRG